MCRLNKRLVRKKIAARKALLQFFSEKESKIGNQEVHPKTNNHRMGRTQDAEHRRVTVYDKIIPREIQHTCLFTQIKSSQQTKGQIPPKSKLMNNEFYWGYLQTYGWGSSQEHSQNPILYW